MRHVWQKYRVIRVRLINGPEVTQLVIVLLEDEPGSVTPTCTSLRILLLFNNLYYPRFWWSDAQAASMFVSGLHFYIVTRWEGQAVLLVSPNVENWLSMWSAGIATPFQPMGEMCSGLGAILTCSAHLPSSGVHIAVFLRAWKTHDHMTSRGIQFSFCSRTWNHSLSVLVLLPEKWRAASKTTLPRAMRNHCRTSPN